MSVELLCDIQEMGPKLYIKVGGEHFTDTIESLKYLRAKYTPEYKLWSVSLSRYNEIVDEMQNIGNRIVVNELTKQNINNYQQSIVQLKPALTRRVYKPELMKLGPLAGKSPYEDFQKQDFLRAINQNRFLFQLPTGAGKSWIATALIEHLRFYNEIDKCLVFTSSIGVYNLKYELLKFGNHIKESEIKVLTSISECGKYENRDVFNPEKYPYRILIMTYDVLKSISDFYYQQKNGKKNKGPKTNYLKSPIPWKEWFDDKKVGLFLDECHALANPKSRRTEIMFQNIHNFEHRYLFSATPSDKYEKLYYVLHCLDTALTNGLSYTEWCAYYNDIGTRYSQYAINSETWHLDRIAEVNKKLISTYAVKREKRDILDIPANYEIPVFNIDMSDEHRKIYEMFSNETVFNIQKESHKSQSNASDKLVNMFQYLQLCVDHPGLLLTNPKFDNFSPELQTAIRNFNYQKHFKKLEPLDAVLEERIKDFGERGIIWAYHPLTIKELEIKYKKYNPTVLNADVPKDQRFDVIRKFQKDTSSKIIIMSIMVANSSITLVECSFEYYLEKIFNYSIYYQSRGRIDRVGQNDTTRTYGALFRNTIDFIQTQNLRDKGKTIDNLLSKNFITSQEWKDIFNGEYSTTY